MFIYKTQTRSGKKGKVYTTHRLAHSIRDNGKTRPITLLNLGADFAVPKENWSLLCRHIADAFRGQLSLGLDPSKELQTEAERIATLLLTLHVNRLRTAGLASGKQVDWRTTDQIREKQVLSRTVGVEYVALWALRALGLPKLLRSLGWSRTQQHAALATIVGRMARPTSERGTWKWLCRTSGLYEFLQTSFTRGSAMQLYRVSDQLLRHRDRIERSLFAQALSLGGLEPTVTLFDLTNTFLEGSAKKQKRAKRGHSKEKRSDAPLVTLALVLDASGFVQCSRVFDGNVREWRTMQGMLAALRAPEGALVVMDRGVATEANLDWLKQRGYRYIVVSRERKRVFDAARATSTTTRSGQDLELYEVRDDEEVRVYCRSKLRVEKERAMHQAQTQRFEAALKALSAGLKRPRTRKRLDLVQQRVGALMARHASAAQHYRVEVEPDERGRNAATITWTYEARPHSMSTHPGVYCLRSNALQMDVETLWHTYVMLTDVEAVFRTLKSELGLRPVYHQTDARTEGHLFIAVLAYQAVQMIRSRLRQAGIHYRWETIRDELNRHVRTTRVKPLENGRTLHHRLCDEADLRLLAIYRGLGISPVPLPPSLIEI